MTKQESVYQAIKKQILKGTMLPGEKLLSIRDHSRQMGIGIQTVLRAYERLIDDGWIEAKNRSGYYVKNTPSPNLVSQNSATQAELINVPKEDIIIHKVFEHAYDPKFVNFGSLIPDHGPSIQSEIKKLTKSHVEELCLYGHHDGDRRLKNTLLSRATQLTGPSKEVILTRGATNSMFLILKAITSTGSIVATESPFYYGLKRTIRALGVRPIEIPLDYQKGLTYERVKDIYEKHPFKALIVSSSFSNPCGVTTLNEEKKRIVEFAKKKKFFVIEDDVYGDLFHSGKHPGRYLDYDHEGVVFYCNSLTKTHACGLKVGWIVSPTHFKEKLLNLQLGTGGFLSGFEQALALELLKSKKVAAQIRKTNTYYQSNINRISSILHNESRGKLRFLLPKGGYCLWVRVGDGVNTEELFEEMLTHKAIIVPGTMFSYTKNYAHYFRLNCAIELSEKNLRKLKKLAKVASSYT